MIMFFINFLKSYFFKCKKQQFILYDRFLFFLFVFLVFFGFIMVSSSSMFVSNHMLFDPFYFVKHNLIYLSLSFFLFLIFLQIPIVFWKKISFFIFLVSLIMLFIVVFFGHPINGAYRWLSFGCFRFQPSEFSKLSLFFYFSSFLADNFFTKKNSLIFFIKPILNMLLFAFALLMQPDLGTVLMLIFTIFTIFFIIGIELWQLFLAMYLGIIILIFLIFRSYHCARRIELFLNPWSDPLGISYQLIQSLISFGRGGLFGQGLGNSIQKLNYLPEVHTDFIFAIIGEELGFFGVLIILWAIISIIFRAIFIGKKSLELGKCFSGYLSLLIAIWIMFQVIINIGGVVSLLPVKGITLPFISYGGSSFLVVFISVTLLLRIDYENRLTGVHALYEINKKKK